MSIPGASLAKQVFITPINAFASMWGPTRPGNVGSNPVGATAGLARFFVIAPLKFLGRTVTIGAGVAATALALKALAGTSVGVALGTTAFVATISAFPPAMILTAAAVGTVATGLLASILIEKYVK